MLKKILIGLLIVLVVIQFIRPAKNQSTAVNAKDITHSFTVPDSVHQILVKACMDCHSDNTRYPWYNNIQPVAWWLNDHVNEGKHELNFDHFGEYTPKRQAKKLAKIAKSVTEGWMPLDSYLWIHKEARLTDGEKKLLADWANNLSGQIAATLPKQ